MNKYSNLVEIITLSELLNIPFEEVLKEDDMFCTNLLLYNAERANFEDRFSKLKRKYLEKK